MKKLWVPMAMALLAGGCTTQHVKSDQLDPSMLLFNLQGNFVSKEFADRLAILVIDEKYPKEYFIRRGPGRIVDGGEAWSVTYENTLGNANDPIPISGGKIVPRTLTIRIRKLNGEIIAISS
jgi:hypothetical protein